MSTATPDLPIALCPHCGEAVITFRDLDEQGALVVRCLSCQGQLGAAGEVEEWLADGALLGYEAVAVKPSGGAGGCGAGGSCGCSSKKKPRPARGFQA